MYVSTISHPLSFINYFCYYFPLSQSHLFDKPTALRMPKKMVQKINSKYLFATTKTFTTTVETVKTVDY